MPHLKHPTVRSVTRLLVAALIGPTFGLCIASANAAHKDDLKQAFAPMVTATLTDSFPDPDGNNRAAAGEDVTYVATIRNDGTTSAENVNYTNTIDSNSTLVNNSVLVMPDLTFTAIRCTFHWDAINTTGSGGCPGFSNNYISTDSNGTSILSGGNTYLQLRSRNINRNLNTQIFSFDLDLRNFLENSLGTRDGTTLDPAGINLFVHSSSMQGSGPVNFLNVDGTATFSAPDQPYVRFNQILAKNEWTPARTFNVAATGTEGQFTIDFFVSTKLQAKVVINEVLSNPGGTISDANGEWVELQNTGSFPVNLRNFSINDTAATDSGNGCEIGPNGSNFCHRPAFAIASDLIVPSGGYAVLGNTVNITNNGGVPVDLAYGATLQLNNTTDGLRIRSPDGTVIDKTFYANAAISGQNGISRELDNPSLNNINMDDQVPWSDALASAVYGPGGRGTPKAQNSSFVPLAEGLISFSEPDPGLSSSVTQFTNDRSNAGETVNAAIGTIMPGGFATVTYRATVANPIPAGVINLITQGTFTGDNFASNVTDDPSTATANDANRTPIGLAPTAAMVSISGRVMNSQGQPLSKALIYLSDTSGNILYVRANPFGYFAFDDLSAGETFIIQPSAKGYSFSPRVLAPFENIVGMELFAQ